MSIAERFRFRFVTRGEQANRSVLCAARSLRRCHPSAPMVVLDANDQVHLDGEQLPDQCRLVHVPPEHDEIARCLGRGTRQHMFYWRHSPQALEAAGLQPDLLDVYVDTDVLFLRPLDLQSLVPHLDAGRIAMAIDRSSIEYYRLMEDLAVRSDSSVFPVAGSRGPMVQGGLLFRNPENDGGLLELLWKLASADARSGVLSWVPWDDMAFLTTLLGHGGPLWGRLLPLGHEWNFISEDGYDPGVFGYLAHYGGPSHVKDHMVKRFTQLFPPVDALRELALWQREPDIARVGYGRVGLAGEAGYDALRVVVRGQRMSNVLSLHPPFSATWAVPPSANTLAFGPAFNDSSRHTPHSPSRVRLQCYLDGSHATSLEISESDAGCARLPVHGAECVTLIGTTDEADYCHFLLIDPRWE